MWKTPKKKKSTFVDTFIHQETPEETSENHPDSSSQSDSSSKDNNQESPCSSEELLNQSLDLGFHSKQVSLRVLGI